MKAILFHREKKVKSFSPTRRIAFSFLAVIFIGSFILSLPIANNGSTVPYLDHLFIATSATCVTGLVSVVVAEQYSLFGQVVIILLIQIGGLGFLTLLSMLIVAFHKKLTYTNKIVMQEALNQSSMSSISTYIKRVMKYTVFFEGIGVILLMFVFIPRFGLSKGVYYSLFHAISAFCNAGFDVLGSTSLINFQTNVLLNLVIAGLIIAGGLGFVVWIDLRTSLQRYQEKFKVFKFKKFISTLSLHTKLVLTVTFSLLVFGTLIFLGLEYQNVQTIGNLSLADKILASFFQSTTLRTAGFATVNMAALQDSTKLIMSMIMFIGGSPAGTAGGIKTVTFAIMLLYIVTLLKGGNQIKAFRRSISEQVVKRSLTIALVSFFICLLGLTILSITENIEVIDLIFEVFSAFATVGLSAGMTPFLTNVGKIVVIILMYVGRIGPMTMVLVFASRYSQMKGKDIIYASEDILIG